MQKSFHRTWTQNQLKSIRKIQAKWKRCLARNNFRKALKKLKRKNFFASQLLSSQKTYCDHLKFLIKQVLEPSKKAIEDDQLHQILFCNITEIFMLHHVFLYKLDQVMKDYQTHLTQISKPILQLFTQESFQTSYTNYCYNYPKADKIMKLLTQNNSSFKQILKKSGIANSAMSLQSYMIKPVQRLCKYEIILAQYFKNMGSYHCDYNNIKKVIQFIQKLVQMTNSQVEQFLFIERYRQLRFEYPQIFSKLTEPKQKPRKLLYQFDKGRAYLLNLLNQEQVSLSTILIFSDFIMLIPKSTSSSSSSNNNSHQKPIIINLIHMRKVQNMKYYKNLLQLIDSKRYYTLEFKSEKQRDTVFQTIQIKTNYLISKGRFYTVDILGTQRRETFFKYYTVYIAQIKQNSKVTKIYPRFKNLLKVQDILIKKNWFLEIKVPSLQKQSPHQTLKSKTIEKRKLHIRQFLQRIINNDKIMENDEIRQTLDYYQGKTKKVKNSNQDQMIIQLPNWQHLTVHMNTKSQKIKDLKSKICLQLQFVQSSQFQIFQIRNKNYSTKRLMYNDESILPLYQSQQAISMLNPFSDKLDYMFSRHYYLSNQQELALYKLDFIRLELELSVIRTEILSYGLEEELMITFMCLFAMYINMPMEDDKISNFIKDIGKKVYKVPLEDFRLYYSQVQKIVSAEEDQLVTVPFLIIKILSNCRLYQCQQFEVEIHQKCFKAVKKQIPSVDQNIILGIKLKNLMLLSIKQKHLIKTIEYKDIQSMEMHPNGIIFKFSQMQSIFRIKTTQGYEINELITTYKQKNHCNDKENKKA